MGRPRSRPARTTAGDQLYNVAAAMGSMRAVASATGINRSHLYDLAIGRSRPTLDDAYALQPWIPVAAWRSEINQLKPK
jgi:hypothetical protein